MVAKQDGPWPPPVFTHVETSLISFSVAGELWVLLTGESQDGIVTGSILRHGMEITRQKRWGEL